ncbi:MAG TPA: hypothetical protein VL501_04390 [Pyrinomonadaceae bacterium]|nr:hypothetical protein [Pyrinomonadaceae bacterium]
MYMFLEFTGRVEALFVSIPESVGLLAFGLGLIGATMSLRWLLARTEAKKEEEAAPKGLM